MTQRTRESVKVQQRQDEALALWIQGKTYPQIAERCGYANKGGAWKAVQRALERQGEESDELAQHGRAIALARLRPLWIRAMQLVADSEATSRDILAALQVADRLARLEGVKDPAAEVRLTVESELDREIEILLSAIDRERSRQAAAPGAD